MRVAVATLLGFLWFFVASITDEILGHPQTSLPTFAITTIHLAVCTFLVAKKGVGMRANLPVLVGMLAPLTVMMLVMVFVEKREVILSQGPCLVFGYAGALIGAWAAKNTGRNACATTGTLPRL